MFAARLHPVQHGEDRGGLAGAGRAREQEMARFFPNRYGTPPIVTGRGPWAGGTSLASASALTRSLPRTVRSRPARSPSFNHSRRRQR
jgi:hypothetical protein